MGRVLIVGLGSTIMSDDGLGVHALRQLADHALPEHADTLEAGTALFDVLPDLRPYDKLILIDAVDAEHDVVNVLRNPAGAGIWPDGLSSHELGLEQALLARRLTDGRLPEVVIIGVKPKKIELGEELSPEVAGKIPAVVQAVLDEVR